jgi:hypothetical protein
LKKIFRDDPEGQVAWQTELKAAELFGALAWMPPVLQSGPGWLRRPWYAAEERLDRAARGASQHVRETMAVQAVGALFDMFRRGYAHRDFHARNLFWVDGQLKVIDFECMTPFAPGPRPPFPQSYDLTGQGLPSPHRTHNMGYSSDHRTGAALEGVLDVPLEVPLHQLKAEFTSRLLAASLDFVTASGRHTCKAQCIYGAFSTPYFAVPREMAQRDSAERLTHFGLDADHLRGRRLLDLGSHTGALVFEAQKFDPAQSLGIEVDAKKVEVANDIAVYAGLEGVAFRCADVDTLEPASLGEAFDVVLCCAIDAHVDDPERLYRLLGAVTGEMLCFEGNSTTDAEAVEAALKSNGFTQVSRLGFCTDDCLEANNCRPVLVAWKPRD